MMMRTEDAWELAGMLLAGASLASWSVVAGVAFGLAMVVTANVRTVRRED